MAKFRCGAAIPRIGWLGVVNAPLLTADQIATGPNSRAEVQFDSANMLRIGGNAEIHLTQLEDRRYQMELARGTITFRVLRASDANVEVDTPSVSVRPSRQGSYRITVRDTGETEITARTGDVEIFSPRGSQWLNAGQTMQVRARLPIRSSRLWRRLLPTIGTDGTTAATVC